MNFSWMLSHSQHFICQIGITKGKTELSSSMPIAMNQMLSIKLLLLQKKTTSPDSSSTSDWNRLLVPVD